MKINLININARSASFEIINDLCYYNDFSCDIYVDDSLAIKDERRNVFSVYDLYPHKQYVLKVVYGKHETKVDFTTKYESAFLDITDFGAKGDGITDDTLQFQSAINIAPYDSTVYVPKGVYKLCPVFLKSGVNIYIDKDATLLGETSRLKYPIVPAQLLVDGVISEVNSWEGNPNKTFASLFTGIFIKDVTIYGCGIIDENANNSDWWIRAKEIRIAARPKGIFLSNCDNVTIQGITITNTPSWNLHPYFSNNFNVIDAKLLSPKDSPNTDGCDPDSTSNINIIGVYISVGDDCIAIKSGKFDIGMKYRKPTENIVIRNCYMRDGHGAVVLGSEMSGGIRNLNISKCLFENTDRGLRIKTRRGRGESAVIDNITFDNLVMKNVLTPLVMNMYYYCDADGKTEYVWSKKKLPVDNRTPFLGRFYFRNMVCTDVNVAAGYFYGLPERPIKSITLENITVTYSKNPKDFMPAMMDGISPMSLHGYEFRFVENVNIKNVKIEKTQYESFVFENVDNIKK
ncbi:MAG: glycoside hydrolase family 28 protein [Acholeplasmatales bacterium]|jgi:polygalacturonase|nr:glycoside hydrolase family 28 protein [Acholeplasmatales bacterium]